MQIGPVTFRPIRVGIFFSKLLLPFFLVLSGHTNKCVCVCVCLKEYCCFRGLFIASTGEKKQKKKKLTQHVQPGLGLLLPDHGQAAAVPLERGHLRLQEGGLVGDG